MNLPSACIIVFPRWVSVNTWWYIPVRIHHSHNIAVEMLWSATAANQRRVLGHVTNRSRPLTAPHQIWRYSSSVCVWSQTIGLKICSSKLSNAVCPENPVITAVGDLASTVKSQNCPENIKWFPILRKLGFVTFWSAKTHFITCPCQAHGMVYGLFIIWQKLLLFFPVFGVWCED